MTESELPQGWRQASLGDLGSEVRQRVSPDPSATYEMYSVPTFQTGLPEVLKGSEIRSSKTAVKPDDVLLCKINPRINRVWSVAPPRGSLMQLASTEYLVLRIPDPVLSRYVMWYLRSPRFREWIGLSVEAEPVKRFETLLIHEFCATSSRATGGLIHATSGSCGAAGGRCRNRIGLAA